jgi:hypothetical protein
MLFIAQLTTLSDLAESGVFAQSAGNGPRLLGSSRLHRVDLCG